MLKRIAQAIVNKNRFEEDRPATTFIAKQAEKYIKDQERENEK